ncbi:MAG: TetR/AcrR family transcriptional regulator [Phycisphaerae bacterium]|jgi:AcrR family transcriptional regulator|nr:TetR/AcrR family transcriptional regulator [Phycisphaerae bacterium]MBT5583104.1 TetR/AcrR family transcriptional regulator [Phycisphaerae bacterium]
MLGLVNEGGMPVVASVRSIASRAGVTEAVLYRYFPTKDAMFREVWETTLTAMVEQKRSLLENPLENPAELLRNWIRITYEQFDQDPAAFHFVFLSEGTAAWRKDAVYSVQGELLGAWLESTIPTEQFAPLDQMAALHCVVDLMLAVPRRIRDGCTDGPAIAHVDYTVAAITRVLGI